MNEWMNEWMIKRHLSPMLSLHQDSKSECLEMPKHFRSKEGIELGEKTLEFESVCDLSRRQYNRMTCSMFISSQVRLCAVLSPLVRGSVSVLIQFPMSWAQGFCHPGQRGKQSLARPTLYTESMSWSYSYISSPGGVPSKLICGSQGYGTES